MAAFSIFQFTLVLLPVLISAPWFRIVILSAFWLL